MKSLALFSLVSVASAFPLVDRASQSVGAAFWITNEPSGNMIISANIGADGTLTNALSTNAGGRGSHGNDAPDPEGPDGLFSQGAIKASAKSQMLVTVNPGSNTMSVFKIDPANPAAIQMIGQPVSSEGEFPMSVALNAAGNMACVANGGAVNGVNCFTMDQKNGLTSIPNSARSLGLNQTTPPAGPAGTVSHTIFNEAGNQLLVSVKGTPPTPGFLAAWDVQSDGSLSQNMTKIAPPEGGVLPFGMTVAPGMNAIVATDAGIGFDVFDMSGAAGNSSQAGSNSGNGAKASGNSTSSSSKGNAAGSKSGNGAKAAGNSTASNSSSKSSSKGNAAAKGGSNNAASGNSNSNSTKSANAGKGQGNSSASSSNSGSSNSSMALAGMAASPSTDVAAGGASSANKVDGQGAVCWVSHSAQTGNFYMTDIKTSLITEVNLDKNMKASVVKQYQVGDNSSATIDTDIAKVNGNDFLYTLAAGSTTINVMKLNAPGQAQMVQSINFADAAKQGGITVSANNLQGMTTFVKA